MKAWKKICLGIVLSLMCLFTGVGYAQLSSTIRVVGDAYAKPPNAIFIVEISNIQTSGTTITSAPVNIGYPSTKFMSEVTFSGRNSYISFDVLIMNGTNLSQYFNELTEYPELEGSTDSFSYAGVDWSVTPSQGTQLTPGERMRFNVTLTYTGRNTNQSRKMLHEFDFVMNSNDLTEAVSEDITDKFTDILNNRLEEDISYIFNGEKVDISKEETYDAVVNNMKKDTSGNYIGNLMGAEEDDKALLAELFGGELTFEVGGTEVPITVMIKQKNVYNTSANEMVLYITADDLRAFSSFVPVYAVVFTQDSTGTWVQVGDIYAGEARTNNYSGWPGSGSFNTESWKSTEVYYGVASGSSINNVINGYVAQNP